MKLIDCHTHTQFSVDSEADLGMCAERADRLGLAAYAVTDHCECNSWYPAEHYSDGDDMSRQSRLLKKNTTANSTSSAELKWVSHRQLPKLPPL